MMPGCGYSESGLIARMRAAHSGSQYSMTKPRSQALPLLITTGMLAIAAGAPAQDGANQPTSRARDAEVQSPTVAFEDELSWLIRRSAILDLRLHESPLPVDYELTANMLSIASDLDPTNAEIAREMVQAAWLAGNQPLMLDATRRVIRSDPRDSVAQLRLISANINTKQTVEERKLLYDRFLSDAGASLDPAVRSRLALDAALLEREAGNTTGFIERLHQATRLDVTNKSAASLAAQYYSSVRKNPVTNLDYEIRLLNADPLDANVHLAIARMLAGQGALDASIRFLDNSIELFKLETGFAAEVIEEIRVAVKWQVDGPREVMRSLNTRLSEQRKAAQSRIDAYAAQQLPTDELRRPLDIRYPLSIDKLRLLAAHSEGDEELTRSVLNDIELSVNEELNDIGRSLQQRSVDINAMLGQVVLRIAELQAMRAIVGLDADRIREDFEEVVKNRPEMADRFGSIEPMALFAEGRYEECLAAAEPFQGSPVISLIIGQSYEKLNRKEDAIELYLRLTHSNAMNVYGAFANTRLVQLGAADRILTDAGREMRVVASKVPDWIDQMIRRPGSFFYLGVEQDQRMYSEGQQPMLTIRLQNTAPIPLALGPNAPIDSRVLIEPVGVKTPHNGFAGDPRPKVLQLDQRLRLEPREELILTINADSASTDWLIDQQPGVAIRQRWRLIQSFAPRVSDILIQPGTTDADSKVFGITSSALGLTAETEVVQRLGIAGLETEPSTLLTMLRSGDPPTRRRAVVAINARMMALRDEDRFDASTMSLVVGALNEVYTSVSPAERAAMMLALPHRHQVPAMIGFDDHVAALLVSDALIDSRIDPIVMACALLTRTDDAEAPIFEALVHVSDPRVTRIGSIVRARLESGQPLIGTVGPGVNAMTPAFDGLEY